MTRRERLATLFRLIVTCTSLSVSSRSGDIPNAVFASFRQLGGVYVKFLQIVAVRSRQFESLNGLDVYDNVATEPLDIVNVLQMELGDEAKNIRNVQQEPFAAGSFAQVYAADYNGESVVLKVLRPSVDRYLRFDLRLLTFISWLLDRFLPSNGISFYALVRQFASTTLLETNYLHEADYASSLHKKYQDHPTIVIPKTYREVSTRRIICQDKISGLPLSDVMRVSNDGASAINVVQTCTGSNLTEQMISLGTEMLTSVFSDNSCYGDPHPGNIILLPENNVALIDFGIRAAAPDNLEAFRAVIKQYDLAYNDRFSYEAYIVSMLRLFGGKLFRAIESLQEYLDIDTEHFYRLVGKLAAADTNEGAGTSAVAERRYLAAARESNHHNEFCLDYDIDGPDTMRAGLTFTALAASLGLRDEIIGPMYHRTHQWIEQNVPRRAKLRIHPDEAMEITVSWLERLSHHNPYVYKKLKREIFNESAQLV